MNTLTVVVDKPNKLSNICSMINEAYCRDFEKKELRNFRELVRGSRKFGFPFVCTLTNNNEQLLWAAKLLISVGRTWPLEDIPENFKLLQGSLLLNDARQLVANGVGNYQRVVS